MRRGRGAEERVDGSPSKSKTHIFQLSALEKVEVGLCYSTRGGGAARRLAG